MQALRRGSCGRGGGRRILARDAADALWRAAGRSREACQAEQAPVSERREVDGLPLHCTSDPVFRPLQTWVVVRRACDLL